MGETSRNKHSIEIALQYNTISFAEFDKFLNVLHLNTKVFSIYILSTISLGKFP